MGIMKGSKTKVGFLLTLIVAILGLARAAAAEDIIFGEDPVYRPNAYYDDNKQLVGFDIDLANAMAERMGAKAKFETMAFEGIIPAIQAGRIDAYPQLSIRPARREQVDFSIPFFSQTVVVVLPKEPPNVNPTMDDLKGKSVGVLSGTSSDLLMSKQAGINLTRYNTSPDAFRDLLLKRIDFVVADSLTAGYQVKNTYPDKLRVSKTALTDRTEIGAAVRKGRADFLTRLNKAIDTMKADGSLDAIVKKWFGDVQY